MAEDINTHLAQAIITMRTYLHRTAVVAAYQASVTLGILMLPLAVALQRTIGIRLPFHRVIEPALRAYERQH